MSLSFSPLILLVALIYRSFSDNCTYYPKDCKPYKNCINPNFPRWKTGLLGGQQDTGPYFNEEFLICVHNYYLCPWIASCKTGAVIAAGVDLSTESTTTISGYGVKPDVITSLILKFLNLFQKNSTEAYKILKNLSDLNQVPQLTSDEATELKTKYFEQQAKVLQNQYNLKKNTTALGFENLKRSITTALISQHISQEGPISSVDNNALFLSICANNWADVIKKLKNISISNNSIHLAEADLIESSLVSKAARPADIIFLIDSSGTIGETNYQIIKDWMKQILSKLAIHEKKIHIGVATFSNSFNIIFDLNQTYDVNNMSLKIQNMPFENSQTYLGLALQGVYQMFVRAGRNESEGIPKFLYIITDGEPNYPYGDNISSTVWPLKNAKINIFAIGVSPMISQATLDAIANKKDHALWIANWSGLNLTESIIVSAVNNEPAFISNNLRKINGVLQNGLSQTQECFVNRSADFHIKIALQLPSNSTQRVKTYVSQKTSNPDEYVQDIKHSGKGKGYNEIVINATNYTTSVTPSFFLTLIAENETNFELSFSDCDPTLCVPGTNEPIDQEVNLEKIMLAILIVFVIVMTAIVVLFCILKKYNLLINNISEYKLMDTH